MNLGYFSSNLSEREVILSAALNDWAAPIGGLKESELIVNSIKGNGLDGTLFLGDSHIDQYWPRVEKIISSSPNEYSDAYFLAWGGCPPFPDTKELQSARPCNVFVRKAFDFAQNKFIRTVVFNAYWEWYFFGTFDRPETHKPTLTATDSIDGTAIAFGTLEADAAFERLENAILKLIQNGKKVVIVLSNPAGAGNNPKTMLRDLQRGEKTEQKNYGVDRKSFIAFSLPITQKLRAIAKRTGATVIDPVESLCEERMCVGMHGNAPIHRDDDHLRPFYVREHISYLDSTVLDAAAPAGQRATRR